MTVLPLMEYEAADIKATALGQPRLFSPASLVYLKNG